MSTLISLDEGGILNKSTVSSVTTSTLIFHEPILETHFLTIVLKTI